MQADDTAFEESTDTHPVPAVIIGITDYKARKDKEEVDGKIAVINDLCEMVATRMCFKKMATTITAATPRNPSRIS